MIRLKLEDLNNDFQDRSPEEIIRWALSVSDNPVVTTSFGIYSAVLLRAISSEAPDIPVIWCDTGYNDSQTYKHAENLIERLNLNIQIYAPKYTRSYIDHHIGLPTIDDPKHEEFTEVVKLEPFRRALSEWKPKVWFTNIRTQQTRFRDSKDILSYSQDGILKVSPFYHFSDADLDQYLEKHKLPKNTNYFDPVKALQNRECGIHNL